MKSEVRTSAFSTACSVLVVLFIIVSASVWKNGLDPVSSFDGDIQVSQRSLQESIDDDGTRDDVCKAFLMNFLNGTTDVKDECEGMLNAYQVADCVDDNNVLHPASHHRKKRNHTVVDDDNNNNSPVDDVLIDDYVEAWECCTSIHGYYNRNCQQAQLASMRLLGIVGVLIACGLLKSLIRQFNVEWIPDAAACILLGAIVGGVIKLFSDQYVNDKLSFDNDLFLNILLPPIIFSSALSIDKRAFRRDLFPILTFAIIGTVFSAVMIGFITNYFTSIGRGTTMPMLESLLFGSLISSIDPVATLSILSGVGISETDTLYTLIFGEALLNDGAAVVLFDTLLHSLAKSSAVDGAMVSETLLTFVRCSIGAIAIGIGCGMACTIYFWALAKRHSPVWETAIFFCFALVPFYLSDGAGMSGIISIMTMGFFLDYFVVGGSQSADAQWMPYMSLQSQDDGSIFAVARAFTGAGHLSSMSRHHVGFVAEVIASLMETAIFAYLGLFLFNDEHLWDLRIKATAVFGCIVSRAVMIILLSAVINLFVWLDLENKLINLCFPNAIREDDSSDSTGSRGKVYLSRNTQQVLLLAGVRGAVSFALVENIPVFDAVRTRGSLYKPELKSMTAASILVTVFVFGPLTYYLVKKDKEEGNLGNGQMLSERLLSDPLNSDDEHYSGPSDLELSTTPPASETHG